MGHRPRTANRITHVGLVLDESASMGRLAYQLIAETDGQVRFLASQNEEKDHEIRITVYTFQGSMYDNRDLDKHVHCVFYDMDVLRLPSIKDFYKPNGQTALIDATMKAINELEETAQRYGDHAFLLYVLTDGMENASYHSPEDLRKKLNSLPENWTVAALVPDKRGAEHARQCGFAPENIAVWDATSTKGVQAVSKTITTATASFLRGRKQGVRGTRSLFSTGADAVNTEVIRQVGMEPLDPSKYSVFRVHEDMRIDDFVNGYTPYPFKLGIGYYQLTKTETIQNHKSVAIKHKQTGRVYTGPEARQILGLGGDTVRVKPEHNPEYDVFVQSTAVNRKLLAHTELLVIP